MIPWHPEVERPPDYCAGMGCGGQWLSIKTAAGQDLNRFFLCGVTCGDCSARPCPPIACIQPDHLPPEGATETWEGNVLRVEHLRRWNAMLATGVRCSRLSSGGHHVRLPEHGPDGGFGCMSSAPPTVSKFHSIFHRQRRSWASSTRRGRAQYSLKCVAPLAFSTELPTDAANSSSASRNALALVCTE